MISQAELISRIEKASSEEDMRQILLEAKKQNMLDNSLREAGKKRRIQLVKPRFLSLINCAMTLKQLNIAKEWAEETRVFDEDAKKATEKKRAEIQQKYDSLQKRIKTIGSGFFSTKIKRPEHIVELNKILKEVKEAEYLDAEQKEELKKRIIERAKENKALKAQMNVNLESTEMKIKQEITDAKLTEQLKKLKKSIGL